MSEQVWKEQAIHLMALLDQEKRSCAALEAALSDITEHIAIAGFDIWTADEKSKSRELSDKIDVARKLLREVAK